MFGFPIKLTNHFFPGTPLCTATRTFNAPGTSCRLVSRASSTPVRMPRIGPTRRRRSCTPTRKAKMLDNCTCMFFLHLFSIYLFQILQPGKGANGPVLLRGLLEDRDAVHAEGVPVWHQRLLRGTKGTTVRQGATSRIRARTTPAQIGHLPALAKLRVLLGDAQIRAVCQVGGVHVNAKCGKSWWVFLFSECVNTIPFLQTSPPRSSGWNA